MPVLSGLGTNYNGQSTQYAADFAYWKSVGLQSVRVNIPNYVYPYNSATNATWRNCAVTVKQAGFYTIWGTTSTPHGALTSAMWQNYHDAVVAEAAYCQSQGYIFDYFEIGNELDLSIDGTTITQTQLYTNLQQLYLDVKAVYSGLVGYTLSASYAVWAPYWTAGAGNFPLISINMYGNINLSNGTVNFLNVNNILAYGPTYFGSNWFLSEFNIDSNNANLQAFPASLSVYYMSQMISLIEAANVSKFLGFKWSQGTDGVFNNQALGLLANGGMNPMWFKLFASQPRFYTPRHASATRSSSVSRRTSTHAASTTRSLV